MIKKPRGTNDILPSDVYKWYYVEEAFKTVCSNFGFHEIRTPMFEKTKLFKRGVGETTDIVQKEMYSVIKDEILFKAVHGESDITKYKLKKKSKTLKPEGTASVVRAFVENKMYADSQPTKVFYNTPCFRYERPQKGRFRQFHQFGIEVFSAESASADAEVISLASMFFNRLGLSNIELRINSIGCPTCKPKYDEVLKDYLSHKLDRLCSTCNDRFNTNPMRIIDCKNPSCQEELTDVPVMLDYLCDDCDEHFADLKKYLDIMSIDYKVDPFIVRGLDYYTKTAFEFISKEIGAQATVCGGGRYNGLVKNIGGPETPGVGFGLGIERLLLTLESNNIDIPGANPLDVFVIALGKESTFVAHEMVSKLRKNGINADLDHLNRSIKAQFRYSDKCNAKYTVIIGERELEENQFNIKNMESGKQVELTLENYTEKIIEILQEEKNV